MDQSLGQLWSHYAGKESAQREKCTGQGGRSIKTAKMESHKSRPEAARVKRTGKPRSLVQLVELVQAFQRAIWKYLSQALKIRMPCDPVGEIANLAPIFHPFLNAHFGCIILQSPSTVQFPSTILPLDAGLSHITYFVMFVNVI